MESGLPYEYATTYVNLLTDAVAEDFGLDTRTSVLPALVANMLWGANVHAIRVSGERSLMGVTIPMIDEAIEITRQLLAEAPEAKQRQRG